MKYIFIVILLLCGCDLFADKHINSSLDSCIENSRKLTTEIEIQKKAISELDSINESLKLKEDTLSKEKEIPHDCPDNIFNCDLCGLVGALFGALISGLIALIIYKRGERKDKTSKRNEILDFGEDIFILADDAVEGSNMQISAINEFIKNVEKEPHKANILSKVPLHQLERIRSLDIDKVKKAFHEMKLSNKDFVNFYNKVDYLYEVYKAVYEDYLNTNEKYVVPFSNEFLKIKGEILNEITNYAEFLRKRNETSKPIYGYIDNLVLEYYKGLKGKTVPDIKYDYENLIYRLINDMVTKYRDEEIFSMIKEKLQSAKEKYISVIGANTQYMNDLNIQIKNLKESTDKLNEIIRKFKIQTIS